MTPLSEAQVLSNQLFDAFLQASGADKLAIQPAALAATEAAFAESLNQFKAGTFRILDLATKLQTAIANVNSSASRARLEAIYERLGTIGDLVHEMEGMRTTWQTNEEFQQVFKDEDEIAPAASHTPLPTGPAVLPKPVRAMNSTTFGDLSDEYIRFFRAAAYKGPEQKAAARKFAETAIANKQRYAAVGDPLGIPWWFIAGVHLLESTYSFTTHLHNGDSLKAKTHRVPAGRPKTGTPPFTWEFSATDALVREKLHNLKDWSLPRALYRWEVYNGTGYRKRGIPTPYLWSYSTIYDKGKYVGDGVFDPNKVSQQCGAAVLLMALVELGAVDLDLEIFTEGSADDAESQPVNAAAVVSNALPNMDGLISPNIDFKTFFETNLPDVTNFQWHEFLVKGGSHASNGLNTDPPRELWPNLLPLVRVLDRFRTDVGHPVVLTSVYRSPAYNKKIGGAKNSQHMKFTAADFKVVGAGTPSTWAALLESYRKAGVFEGGIGKYGTFVHVDVRGHNVDW